jgi:hypothetical protein
VRRAARACASASTLVPLLVLAACPSLGEIGVSSPPDATVDQTARPRDGGVDARVGDSAEEASCDADVATDPANCGRCGHDCLGGGCTGGACEPVLLYSGNTPTSIVVDGPTLFVTVNSSDAPFGFVLRCSTTDCAADYTMFATDQLNPWFAVQQGGSIYWADFAGDDASVEAGSVAGCPTDGGCPEAGAVVYTPKGAGFDASDATGVGVTLLGLAADSTYLYWAAGFGDDGAVFRCVPSECAATLARLGTTFGVPFALAVDPSYLFWIDIGPNEVVRCALPACGGGPEIFTDIALSGLKLDISGLAIHGGNVYWTQGVGEGGVFQCPTTGCGAGPKVIAKGQAYPIFIAVDDSGIYWSNYSEGTVLRCPLAGCEKPTPVARTPYPFAITLDPVSIYYTSSPGLYYPGVGKVYRVAK